MNDSYVRVSGAPKGSTPFQKDKYGYLVFEGQGGRRFDYGHAFDEARGYRIFFSFSDTPAFKNTWGPESLLEWAASCEARSVTAQDQKFFRICKQQARQCIRLNEEWERLGCPSGGIPMDQPKGQAS